jgi:glycosyltransferase involved in cell wall biosynthesis
MDRGTISGRALVRTGMRGMRGACDHAIVCRKTMKRKTLVMAAANHWRSPFQVGSHHLARGFVKAGWDVAFISDPISPWHVAGDMQQLRARYRLYARGGEWDLDNHLWAYVPAALVTPHNKPVLSNRWVARRWSRLTWPPIDRVMRRAGFSEADLIYCDSAVPFSWLQDVPHRKAIYRIADHYAAFDKCSPALNEAERDLAKWVDLVVYAAQTLEGHVKSMHPRNMAHMPNGVNFDHFSRNTDAQPCEYDAIPKPIAIYVGAMEVWFNWELMNFAVAHMPEVSFVLIGPDDRARKMLKPAKNLFVLGARPYDRLPPYLQHAAVGLIPFDVANHRDLVRSIHPLKLYEYLASGLPVVAVEWEELHNLKSPAVLTHGREHFLTAIREAVSRPSERPLLQSYAARHDWSRMVQRLIDLVGLS